MQSIPDTYGWKMGDLDVCGLDDGISQTPLGVGG